MTQRRPICVILALMAFVLVAIPAGAEEVDAAHLRELMQQLKEMGAPNEAQMKMIVDQAGAMQACLHDLNVAALSAITGESEALMSEIKVMCADGKRDTAQSAAINFAGRVATSTELKQIADCTAGMEGLLPSMAKLAQQAPNTDVHVCDAL